MIKISKKYRWNPITTIKNSIYLLIGIFELYLFVEYIKIIMTNI